MIKRILNINIFWRLIISLLIISSSYFTGEYFRYVGVFFFVAGFSFFHNSSEARMEHIREERNTKQYKREQRLKKLLKKKVKK